MLPAALAPIDAWSVLAADGRRCPVVDGIPYLRTGRDALRLEALGHLDLGEVDAARAVLLTDVDDGWDGPVPSAADAQAAVVAPTLRAAMEALRMGRAGHYCAHRWSDPTYLAGLAVLRLAWPTEPGLTVVDFVCDAGHYLRELLLRGHHPQALLGLDVVWAKLWLARRHVLGPAGRQVRLVCLDATAQRWPVPTGGPALVLCADALSFLRDRPAVIAQMLAVAGPAGTVVVTGAVTPARPHSGDPLPAAGYAALLPGADVFDDAVSRAAAVAGTLPVPPRALRASVPAVSLLLAGPATGDGPDLAHPAPGRTPRTNPLYDEDGELQAPGAGWVQDYGDRLTHLPERLPSAAALAADPAGWARRRVMIDLPETW